MEVNQDWYIEMPNLSETLASLEASGAPRKSNVVLHLILLAILSLFLTIQQYLASSMFSRINQLARHFSRPLPNYLHNSASRPGLSITSRAMAEARNKRMINTAACLIIGDEVLGGKVS